MKEFKAFVLRGNVIDLAVGVVVGAAFGTVIASFVKNLLTPFIALPGTVQFSDLKFTIHHQVFNYGAVLSDIIAFLIVAAAVFFFVVKPLNHLMARFKSGEPEAETTRECPECISKIPMSARRCAFCTSEVLPA